MIRTFVVAATLISSVLWSSDSMSAVPVECPKCANIVTQLRDSVAQAKILATEINSYVVLGQQYATAVQNTIELPMEAFAKAQNVYYRAENIANATGRLISSDAPMMQRLAAAKSLSARTGRFPDGTVRSAQWWGDRVEDQWADNQELLGLEEERRQLNAELLELSASNGDLATGQFQMLQSQHSALLALGNELQALNANQERQFMYTLEKDTDAYLKQKDYENFMANRPNWASWTK